MATTPPYLKKGDTIGIVCPSGFMPYDKAVTCINTLQQWGYKVKVGKTLGHQCNYFSGTDEERLNDLQQMLDDDGVQAVLCGRGGYGMSRIIDQVDFKKFRKKPKWVIGYSDITVFHSHIYRRFNIAGLHAPMAAAFNDEGYKNEYILSLKRALSGKIAKYSTEPHAYNITGSAAGELVGGNLSILAHLIGTPSGINTRKKILFIEDIGEYIYNIDRMMYQMKRSGKLDDLAGLVIGSFSDMKDTTVPYGSDVIELLHELVKDYSFPVCFNFPVGHDNRNLALKIGVQYELKVGLKKVTLH